MKILFVRTYCPNKVFYGSEMRSSRFVEYLRQKGQVDLLTLTKPTEQADMDYIKAKFSWFYSFDQIGEHDRLKPLEKLKYLLPWQITGHYAKDFQAQLNRIVEENQYDLIFVFKLEPVFYFLQLPREWHSKIVIDFDDILSVLYRNTYKNIFTAIKNSYSLKFYETRALARFKRVFVCSQDAVAKIAPRHRGKVGIVPNIFPAGRDNFYPQCKDQNSLLYVGSLDYFPNTEGLKWFFDVIWPEAKRAYPDWKMIVVGKTQKDSAFVASLLGKPKDVEIILNVPSVQPYYRDCFASVVPLLNGSGTRLKILESAAYGRPALSTLKGMEGLDFEDKKNIFVFKDAQSFLDGYKVLLDQKRYNEVAQDAFGVLEKRYSPGAFISSMDENWGKIVG